MAERRGASRRASTPCCTHAFTHVSSRPRRHETHTHTHTHTLALTLAAAPPSPSLSPQVINLFFKLLEDREAKAAAAKAAGRTGDPLTQAPRCHFCQTNFYTKLVGGGYDYKQVRRWTKKVRHVPKHACMHACIQWSAGGRRRGGSESRPTRPGSASTSCAAPLPTIGQRSPPS